MYDYDVTGNVAHAQRSLNHDRPRSPLICETGPACEAMSKTILNPERLMDQARDCYKRAAAASNRQVRDALLQRAREFEQKARIASGNVLVR